jgi:hypothetical protein
VRCLDGAGREDELVVERADPDGSDLRDAAGPGDERWRCSAAPAVVGVGAAARPAARVVTGSVQRFEEGVAVAAAAFVGRMARWRWSDCAPRSAAGAERNAGTDDARRLTALVVDVTGCPAAVPPS